MSANEKIVTVDATLVHMTKESDGSPRAYLLQVGDVKEWVPAEPVEDHKDGTFSMPYNMAHEKGFI